jgi:hypothetical protein
MPTEQSTENVYLGEVLAEQAQVERELKRQAPLTASPSALMYARARRAEPANADGAGAAPPPRAIDYRISGLWRWKTVIVPPNVYVVHTRRGYFEPVTLGLGTSFRFDEQPVGRAPRFARSPGAFSIE